MKQEIAFLSLLFILGSLLLIANPHYGLKFAFNSTHEWLTYRYTDNYYITHGLKDVGGNNIVTDIVFDYRGYDTIGEATVLFTAIAGAVALLRPWRRDRK